MPNSRIPAPILSSAEFRSLTEKQQSAFGARLDYCRELAEKATSASVSAAEDFPEELDSLELDALAVASLPHDPDAAVSSYVLHSSWTFECRREQLASAVDEDVLMFIDAPRPGFRGTVRQIQTWLCAWAACLRVRIDNFESSPNFARSVAQLILADVLIASLLEVIALSRMNANLD